ncbi:hypothetical protein, partial [Acinetobacter baumannii]|jgi:hypothetical protein|uniref:hypothetical protein n=1 Tax=Acinetobacter baumannii TaxID=470 RepID=UPI0039EE9C4F
MGEVVPPVCEDSVYFKIKNEGKPELKLASIRKYYSFFNCKIFRAPFKTNKTIINPIIKSG